MAATMRTAAGGERIVRLFGRDVPVVGPSIRNPQLQVAACITTVQVLGQTVLGFELSIAQLLLTLGICAAMELSVTFVQERAIVWPGSGLLAGNGIALIFRVNGTEHGDWWSLHGWSLFAACAVVSMASKWAIRWGDRHLFNPSNFGLVVCFLIFGTGRVNPLDFWWGPLSPGLVAAYVVIVVGGLTLLRRIGLIGLAVVFWMAFAGLLAVVAAGGHAISARWRVGPVTDWSFWRVVVFSPEVLIFLFFMITDPRTIPRGRVNRLLFGAVVGASSALLVAPQRTEFAAKVAVLAGLLVGCALRPLFERWGPAPHTEQDDPEVFFRGASKLATVRTVGLILLLAGVVHLVSLPARTPLASAGVVVADSSVVDDRPDVDIPAHAVPPVVVRSDVRDVLRAIDEEEARRLVTDVLAGLVIERDAGSTANVDLASTALAGPRFDAFAERARTGGVPVDATMTATRAEVIVIRDATNPQAVPRLGVRLEGTDSSGVPTEVEVAVIEVDDTHLISNVDSIAIG